MPATISENAMKILEARYLDGDSVDSMWDRVSGGVDRFRNLLSELRFIPNSPTLFNMGKGNKCTSAACFVFEIDDEMGPLPTDNHRSIVNTRAKAVAVAKAGGGVGYYFGNLRPRGSLIKSIHRKACGPVAVLKDYHAIHRLITQGGKRDLAQMGVLNVEHPDILEFIHVKDEDPQSLSSFNISVSWSDEWLERCFAGGSKENKVWKEHMESAWKTGCPGILFPDTINKANINPHLGLIKATNPCGEVPNRCDEPCSLGSLSLPKYFAGGNRDVDWKLLEEDAYTAFCFMDDILDRNEFPHPEITKAAFLTRRLGLGVMGWANLLALMHIHYDTQKAVDLGGRVMKLISDVSLQASIDLAKVKGPYLGYDPVKTNGPFCRNETRTSIAPTGTIALIANVFGSIEPFFALEWDRTTQEGIKMKERISCWKELEGFVPKTANEVSPEWHVKHQAAFQKHTCLGVSKTNNLPNSATVEDVSKIYKMMYASGCKGGTIFRDGCRSEQVLVSKKTTSVFAINQTPSRRKMPSERQSITHKFRVSGTECFLTVGFFEDNKTPGELFLRASKMGSTISGILDTWAITFSLALQSSTSLETLCKHHAGTRFEPHGPTDNPNIPVCTSIPDYVVRWMYSKFIANKKADEVKTSEGSGIYCPECDKEVIYQSGCLVCINKSCNWSRCG